MPYNQFQGSNIPPIPDSYFPIEEIARYPLPGMIAPNSFAFSPEAGLLTYLSSQESSLTRQLYGYDIQSSKERLLAAPTDGGTTEENISREEALRRERARQMSLGITQYLWASRTDRMIVPISGEIFVIDHPGAPLRKLASGNGKPLLDPRFSPDGNWVSYVMDGEIYLIPFERGIPRQLTHGARETGKTNGLAEYIAQEEMDRNQGYWWSTDGKLIAFEEVDESHIPIYPILHQGMDSTGTAAQENHRYPFAGMPNAHVRLGVVSIQGGDPVWMNLGEEEDIYLTRVRWLPDGNLAVQVLNREQTLLKLLRLDPTTGKSSLLIEEKNEVWVNLHNCFYPLKDGHLIWASERTGFRHLYLYDQQGDLLHALTQGEWMVEDLVGVDESQKKVYFTATRETPLEIHLYSVSLQGGELIRLTEESGIHSIVIDKKFEQFVDTYHSLTQPPRVILKSLSNGIPKATIFDVRDPRIDELALEPPEIINLLNRNGDQLYGAIYRPPEQYGPGPFPTIVSVYGGPHVQLVNNGWGMTAAMRAQYLRSLGYLVFVLDNRGSARRGLAFEGAIKHEMGHHEVEDQVDGVEWLVNRGLADPYRIGIYGWSYGGYMSAMCLAQAPETFKVAIAGAPVTHYDGYDTFYTERYMGTPQSNPEGYRQGSVMAHVENITGKLLLVHGLIDENVHFRHTARLINALIKARKPYDLLLFPDERHSPRKLADRVYMEERIRDFLIENL